MRIINELEIYNLHTHISTKYRTPIYIRENEKVKLVVVETNTNYITHISFSIYGNICEFSSTSDHVIISKMPGFEVINANAPPEETTKWTELLMED